MKIGLRELTFFLLLAAIVGGAGWFVFLPHWKDIQATHKETHGKKVRLTQLDHLGQTSDGLTKELGELTKALEFFESKLPADQQMSVVLREITQITDRHGLITKSVRTLKQIEASEYVAQPIEMDMAGTFEGFYQFLLELERMPRITRISQMVLDKDKDNEGIVSSKMVVSIYFEPSNRGESSGTSVVPVPVSVSTTRRRPAAGGER